MGRVGRCVGQVWDVRGKLPLHTVLASEEKLLAAAWHGEAGAEWYACGGADSKLHIYSQSAS